MVIVQRLGKELAANYVAERASTWGRRWKLDLEASYKQTCSDLHIA